MVPVQPPPVTVYPATTMVVEQDAATGALYVQLPEALLQRMGWGVDTTLEWHIEPDGAVWLVKAAVQGEIAQERDG
jgi:hypothetical protein